MAFNPDELKLSKDYLLGLTDKIIKRWKSNGTDFRYIAQMYVFQTSLKIMPGKFFNYVWSKLIGFINFLQIENAKAIGLSTNEKWANVLSKIDSSVDDGFMDLK